MGLATLQDASIDSIEAVSTVLGQQTCHRCILACVITAQQDDSRRILVFRVQGAAA